MTQAEVLQIERTCDPAILRDRRLHMDAELCGDPAAAGEANVAFAFRYTSPGNRWWWAVDEVRISADP